MSKAKSKVNNKKVQMDEEMDTSDDDYIDQKMEKYFKSNKQKIEEKLGLMDNGSIKTKKSKDEDDDEDFEDISDYEEEEEDEEEMEEDEKSESEEEQEHSENENGLNDVDENGEYDGRKKLTMKMINNWSTKLSVYYNCLIKIH